MAWTSAGSGPVPAIAGWDQAQVDATFGAGTFARWNGDTTAAVPQVTQTPAPAFDMTGYRALSAYLTSVGLGSLFTTGADGSPGGWLYQQMQAGMDTQAEIAPIVEATPEWQTRFAVIVQQRKDMAAGKPGRVMEVGDVINYEEQARTMFRNAGLPTWMYDDNTDFNSLMIAHVSTVELGQRLGQAYGRVHDTPSPIRAAFEQFYGVNQGDAALASYYLNPDRTMASIDTQSRAAYAAGSGTLYGLSIDKARAEAIANQPTSEAGIVGNLTNIAQQGAIFNEGVSETGTNLDASTTGVDATFFGDANANQAIERRVRSRQANNVASGGGALQTNRGISGTGISNQQ